MNSVAELIAYAKAHPDELSYGSSGVGSVFHLMGELFNETAGVKIKHVPYRGVAPAMQDVIGGHIPMVFISVSNADPAAKAGQVKILAVLEPARYSQLPDVPSMSEIIPAFRKPSSWFGFFGPPGLPEPIVTRLNTEMVRRSAAGRGDEVERQGLRADRRNAAAVRRPLEGRHRALRRHHQGRRHPAGVSKSRQPGAFPT